MRVEHVLYAAMLVVGCGGERKTQEQVSEQASPTQQAAEAHDDKVEPAPEPEPIPNATAAEEPAPEPSVSPADETGSVPEPEPEPKKPRIPVDESVQAFGKKAFETLHGDDSDAFLALTPYANDELKSTCPKLTREAGLESKLEVTARFKHCRKVLDWNAVEEATVAGGELTGDHSPGCEAGVAELEPIRMRVKTPAGVYSVDLFTPVARDGEVIGISGALKCAPLR